VRRSPTGGAFARVRASSTHATSTILLVPVSQGRVFLKAEKGSRVHVRIDLLGYDTGTVPPKAKGRSAVALVQGRSAAGEPTTVEIARHHGAPRAKKLLAALVRVTTRKAAASGGVQIYAAGGDAGAAVAPIVTGRPTSTIVLVPTGSTGQIVVGSTVDARVRVDLIGYVSQPAGVVADDPDPTADTPAPAPAPAPTPAPVPAPAAATGAAAVAVQYALSKVGAAYVAGASGPTSFDCSGLTMAAWAAAGVKLTHISRVQYDQTQRIALADIQPGDLLFYLGNGVHHVTMYVGNGQMVNAANPASGVVISAVSEPWYAQRLTGVGRVVG
jgi:cell wall-associated NlpC family hydrolase